MENRPIEDCGIIGDLHTVALVSTAGAIDFMCFPHFDSPSVFASLLDRRQGGEFCIAPVLDGAETKQLYMPDSAILLTRFLSEQGVGELSDFMPVEEAGHDHEIIRRAKTVRGEVRWSMRCAPGFDYARAGHRVELRDAPLAEHPGLRRNEAVFTPDDRRLPALRLRTHVPLEAVDGAVRAEFTLAAGETAAFVLEEAAPERPSHTMEPRYIPTVFKRTLNFWQNWIRRSTYHGRWREMTHRSAVTLKLLTARPYGSMVASPTFGLPEDVGGVRNWDYRYTWIRDASFALYALIRMGMTAEAAEFMGWVEARCRDLEEGGSLLLMYGVDGSRILSEEVLEHLDGYRGSRPVRIGNAAAQQLQLDIYGELMDAVYLSDKFGGRISHDLWSNLIRLVDWVCEHWTLPDESIWEVRGGRREFLYSRVLCWVALDRAVRLARKHSLPGPIERWWRQRDAIYRDIFTSFWDEERAAFVQYKGAKEVDAACLLMPLVRFIAPTDPRWLSTLRAIERDLVEDSLVYRYRIGHGASDGLTGGEGTFCMCSFWYVECLARAGELKEARFFFEKMLGYANHLGLYGEMLGHRGEHLGNFPQAFTHIALISAAYELDRRLAGGGGTGRSGR
jgi:GH15 family glucan-1,4-alpha-glucosidase